MSAAKRVAHAAETIRARWEQNVESDPQTEAAQALDDTCQLLDPEVAAELKWLRVRLDEVHRIPQDTLTPAEVRLSQYGERTKSWSTATYDSGTERALHEIACALRDTLEEVRDQRNAARLKVLGLEAERHSTNEALSDITVALREKQDAPLTVFRASHESIVMGRYTNRQAAMDHVHAVLANEEGCDVTARVIWRADDPEADEPTWECWLFDADMADDSPTGYVVTPLEVASAYDGEAAE
ncbi:hypothetical protein QBA57_28790 [Streptomyces scabiei]|uniref:hypothetical protein n=1 Tax=Streptomyces scabiei TaxID=1930 RepID=UPI001B337BC0|nr:MULTISPECIES: hypothetical protein [Streptomyces]MBP5883136.1 hypothetical protein [Streptomyces sp. LBUM 1487]MDX2628624.1 hypothetical protein [Streptomyces scabiei]MDX3162710.1 hypothetical protein [Streptomyces scabiei]